MWGRRGGEGGGMGGRWRQGGTWEGGGGVALKQGPAGRDMLEVQFLCSGVSQFSLSVSALCVCVCVCVYVCVSEEDGYTCIHTYIHTYTQENMIASQVLYIYSH